MPRKGVEGPRCDLPGLSTAPKDCRSMPIANCGVAVDQQPLTLLTWSGKGLWGKESRRTVRRLRDEWSR
jgi:hypothetical protein